MSASADRVEFQRDCDAVQIPAGHRVTIPKGTDAFVTQSLGGSYTLQVPSLGALVRVAGADADAIGKEPVAAPRPAEEAPSDLEARVWEELKTCYDPEIPVNIVDLGLVYDLRVTPGEEGSRVDVKMTLTAQGCGMGGYLAADAEQKLMGIPGVQEAKVAIVWEPPWSPHMISAEGRAKLGIA